MNRPNRREMLGLTAGAAVSMAFLGGCRSSAKKARVKTYANAEFYGAEGKFDAEKAKAAYYDMMERFGYPIVPRLQAEEFWAIDFNLGHFTECGMAGIFWMNNQEHDYLGHEIYLLPGQMIPEHWHVKTQIARAKVEAWQVRHGSVTLFSEGKAAPDVAERIPPLHRDIAKARHEQLVHPGEYGYLEVPTARHFMLAGPEGAIVTEYASFHDMAGLRFTHPGIWL